MPVLVPGRNLFRRLADQLDDLGLRLGLGEQSIDFQRLDLLIGRGGFDELLYFGAIEIETRAARERAIRDSGTGQDEDE